MFISEVSGEEGLALAGAGGVGLREQEGTV